MRIKHKIQSLLKDSLFFDMVVILLGAAGGGFLNFIYRLVCIRFLPAADYGTLNALIALVMLGSVGLSPLGTTFTRFFTEYAARNDFALLVRAFKAIAKKIVFSSLLIFLLFAVASPLTAKFLNTRILYVNIAGVLIAVAVISPLFMSVLQSLQRFKLFSSVGIVSAFFKIVVGAFLMWRGFGVLGGILGYFTASAVALVMPLYFIPRIFRRLRDEHKNCPAGELDPKPFYRYFFPVSLAMFAFSSFTNIDSIIVKHFFSSVDTGYYSIAQNIASIALFLPSALAIVIFPKSTKAFVEGRDSPRILRKSLLLAAAFCFLFVAGVFIVPNTVLILFTGKTNPASAGLLGLLSAALSFYALTWIMINFLLAVHNLDFIVPFAVLAGLEAICVYNCHQSLMMVGYTVTIFAVLAFTMLLWSARNKVHIRQG